MSEWIDVPQQVTLNDLNAVNRDDEIGFEPFAIPLEPHWTEGEIGATRTAALIAFTEKQEEAASRSFFEQLCHMPRGIGWFGVIGADGARRTAGAANVLGMLLRRLSFDELIVMLMKAGASDDFILALDVPVQTMMVAHLARGDVDKFVELLDRNASAPSSSLQLSSLLPHAVRGASLDAVRLLLDRGAKFADCSETDLSEMLMEALVGKNVDIVRQLVEHVVVDYRHVRQIVSAGFDACRLLLNASTPPHLVKDCVDNALFENQLEIVSHCIDLGATPARDRIATSIAMHAEFFHFFRARNLLDESLMSRALKLALRTVECAALLIDAGADFNNPALVRLATHDASVDVIQLLIKKGVDFRGIPLHSVWRSSDRDRDMDGLFVPIPYECRKMHRFSMETLLLAGADASALDADGHSALFNWTVSESVSFLAAEELPVAQALVAATPELPPDIDGVVACIKTRQEEIALWASQGGMDVEPSITDGSALLCNLLFAAGCEGPFPAVFVIDPAVVAEQKAIIEQIRYRLARVPILKICLALEPLGLPALVTLAVIDAAVPLAPLVSMHHKWNVITAVKHRNKN